MEPPLRRQSSSLWNLTPRISSNVATNIRNLPKRLGASSFLFSTLFLALGGVIYFYFYYGDVDRDGKDDAAHVVSFVLLLFEIIVAVFTLLPSSLCLSSLSLSNKTNSNLETIFSLSLLFSSLSLSSS